MQGDYGVSATFNVANLSPYLYDDTFENLRVNSSQQGEDIGDQATTYQKHIPTIQVSHNKSLRSQELTQMIKDMLATQTILEPI